MILPSGTTTWIVLAVALLLAPVAEAASAIIDPFLEKFRVGHYRDPERLINDTAWPEELFAPLTLDSLWQDAALRLFDGETLPQSHHLLTWRILTPALGSVSELKRWHLQHQEHLQLLIAGAQHRKLMLPEASITHFLLKELHCIRAMNHYRDGRYDLAAKVMASLLDQAKALSLAPEEVFIWSLRHRRAIQLSETAPIPATTKIWQEIFPLGPYDAQSAWALWVAHRRALGQSLLPPGEGRLQIAEFLASLSSTWLTADDLRVTAFSPVVKAGLGAVALSTSSDLSRHFKQFPQPPAQDPWQRHWLRGRRAWRGKGLAQLEYLAALPGLTVNNRLDLWRRASEVRLLQGEWTAGLANLARAWEMYSQGVSKRLHQRLLEWSEQALVLAVAFRKDEQASELLAQAQAQLSGHPKEKQQYLQITAPWREKLGLDLEDAKVQDDSTGDDSPLASAKRLVRAGRAPDIETQKQNVLPPITNYQERLWKLWARWGRGLAEAAASECAPGPCQDYLGGLRAAETASTPAARHALACAAIGRFLQRSPLREPVVNWLLEHDLAALASGPMVPSSSPIPRMAKQLRGKSVRVRLQRHALLGICLAVGDGRGQLAMTTVLPQGNLSLSERLLFLYPLPLSSSLRHALTAAGVEPALVLSVARNESLFDPAARSRAGALGWLQIMPFHLDKRGVSAGRPRWQLPMVSLDTGARLLREDSRRFGGDPYRTVAAYNAGGQAVRRWTRQLGGQKDRDLFLAWIGYPETRRYTEKVLIDRMIYDWILEDEAQGNLPPPVSAP